MTNKNLKVGDRVYVHNPESFFYGLEGTVLSLTTTYGQGIVEVTHPTGGSITVRQYSVIPTVVYNSKLYKVLNEEEN